LADSSGWYRPARNRTPFDKSFSPTSTRSKTPMFLIGDQQPLDRAGELQSFHRTGIRMSLSTTMQAPAADGPLRGTTVYKLQNRS
jgi:hypothetical protein